jgi:hypothetical protein
MHNINLLHPGQSVRNLPLPTSTFNTGELTAVVSAFLMTMMLIAAFFWAVHQMHMG